MAVLLIEFAKEHELKLDYDFLSKKMSLDTKELDKVLSSLVLKGYLKITADNNGIVFNIDSIFEFDPEAYELVENQDVYDIFGDFLGKPLGPSELQKVSDLLDKYGQDKVIDALRVSEANRKYSLAYVEGVLRHEEKG